MLTRAMMFIGSCGGCRKHAEVARAAVEVSLDADGRDKDEMGEYICVACARRLAKRLIDAANKASANVAAGLVFRHDRWQKPPKRARLKPVASPSPSPSPRPRPPVPPPNRPWAEAHEPGINPTGARGLEE